MTLGPRILVVDDEPTFRQTLVLSLRGHDFEVRESDSAAEALVEYEAFQPDLVLLDLMLPDDSGLNVCRQIRGDSGVPIIVLSVHGEERTKVRALDLGADDYLTKPFGSEELLARIRAILRRPPLSVQEATTFDDGSLKVDLMRHQVFIAGEEVRLSPTEFDLLRYFVENAGKVLRHDAILAKIWGEEYAADTQILRTYIKQLRSKLKDDSTDPRFIRTEPGLGYRFLST